MSATETTRRACKGAAKAAAGIGESATGDWYSDGLRFECTQCGICCTGRPGIVDFTPAELEAMARRLGLLPDEFLKRYARRRKGWWCLREVEVDGQDDCVFLVREPETGRGLCAVYDARPAQCRTWPFWPENLESPEAWAEAAKGCPGMRNGDGGARRAYPVEEIRRLSAASGS